MTRLLLCTFLLALAPASSAMAGEMPNAPPPPLEPRPFTLPPVSEYTLSNGLTVLLIEDHEIPMVWMQLAFGAGSWADPAGQEGLASAAMDMLDMRTRTKDHRTLSMKERRLGSDLYTTSGLDGSSLRASCLKRNLEPTLDLMAEVLTEAVFWADDLRGLTHGRKEVLAQEAPQPTTLCKRALYRVLHGDSYAGRFPTESSYDHLPVGDVLAWVRRNLHPGDARLLVTGDVSMEEIAPLLEERLADWKAGEPSGTPSPQVLQPETTTLYLMDAPDAVQSVIGLGRFVSRRTDDDYLPLVLGHNALGGIFSGRIGMNLREDKGWTYGVHSTIVDSHAPGLWRLYTSVETDVTAEALTEILDELRAVRTSRPLTSEEIERARANRLHSWPSRFSDPDVFLGELADMGRYDLPADWVAGYLGRLREIEPDAVNAAVVKHLDPGAMAIVVVGDMGKVRESLDGLALPVVEIDRWGVGVGVESVEPE